MSMILAKTYAAFKEANVSEEKALEAAQELAEYSDTMNDLKIKITNLEGKITLLHWMVTFNLAISVAILWRVFS